MNIAYFRVSKKSETIQDLDQQINIVLDKFALKKENTLILKERGSAYNVDNMKNRTEFLKLINILFDENTTIKDLFLKQFKKKICNIYIWGFERLSRNFEFSLLFSLLSDLYDIHIYSYKEGEIFKKQNEKALEKMLRYFKQSITAFSGEKYSDEVSENTKKSIMKENKITVSTYGNKWGKKFKDVEKKTLNLTTETINRMNEKIKKLKYLKSQNEIINKINKEFGVLISKSYISKLKI